MLQENLQSGFSSLVEAISRRALLSSFLVDSSALLSEHQMIKQDYNDCNTILLLCSCYFVIRLNQQCEMHSDESIESGFMNFEN